VLLAAKHVDPYLWIPQLMHQPERNPVAKNKRREVRLCVFMMLGKPAHVVELTGTEYQGQQQLTRYTYVEKGKEHTYTGFSAKEYKDCIKSAFDKFFPSQTGRGGPDTLVLIQDKSSSHTANLIKEYCAQRRPKSITLVTLPTESPDLTPCDSNFFGVVKKKWRMQTNDPNMSWDEKASKFVSIVKATSPDPYIKDMPLRWQACEQEQGYHIEHALVELQECE
jgi:hypothetical protein